MECPCCQQSFRRTAIKHTRKGRGAVEFQCPHCEQWLTFEPKMVRLRMLGFLILLISCVISLLVDNIDVKLTCSIISLGGALLALYSVWKGKVIAAPHVD